MPLFSRRRSAPEPTPAAWRPLCEEPLPLRDDAASMNDDGQVLQSAYRVNFTLAAVPDSRISVCTYAVDCEGKYWKGLRYEYIVWGPGPRGPVFHLTLWEKDPDDESYPTPAAADDAALELARVLVRDPVWAARVLPSIFDWDGVPWER